METIKKHIFWVLAVILFMPLLSNGQTHPEKVTGTITDDKGLGLPGVTIVIENTTLGTYSDIGGKYELSIPSDIKNPVLVYTFIGFETQTRIVGQNTKIDVTLLEESLVLDEVVVVGYGVQRKVDLTGSISSVDAEQIRAVPVAGIDQALQGR
ncbi:MAG: carboxypeptidase-like regulatory domain-containing protein, partial [Bacteroidales bacterium]|nr:carboxypeptidase-like regulatory domain-containing protein [Bacteroidales bacterium]